MKVRRLDHLVFAVEDLAAAAAAWAETLGLQAQPLSPPPDAPVELAFLHSGGRDARSAFLELARPTGDGHPALAQYLAERGEGMFSLALEVRDLDAAVEELRSRGVAVSGPDAGLLPGTRVARIDPASAHGVRLQLIERQRS